MRSWTELGIVETIYEADPEEEEEDEEDDDEEDEEDEDTFTNPLSSFTLSSETFPSVNLSSPPASFHSSAPDLQIVVDAWSNTAGYKSNVVIRVHGYCFSLHREPMSSRSRYLRRRLSRADEVSVSPPLNITVETFTDVARFCYTGALSLTPLNLADLTVAAVLLEMDYDVGDWNLVRRTADFFRQEIAGDLENVATVLQCCVGILPGAGEAAAEMAARCVQLLTAAAEGEDGGDEWIAELMEVSADSFGMIMESMARWSVHDHDYLYRIADRYFGVNKEKLTDEEKLVICNCIDCTKLSHHLLLHLVQNSRLPLRFIFKAMLLPQTSTNSHSSDNITTTRDLLRHDAAARQAANLAVRIESLERDVAGLRHRLRWSEEKRAEMESGRAESFRFLRGGGRDLGSAAEGVVCIGKEKKGRGLGRKLMEGFRRMFRRERSGGRDLLEEEEVEERTVEGGHVTMNKYLAFY